MTTPSTVRKAGPLLGNDSQTAFPFGFKVFAASDVAVTVADADGVESLLVLDTDYSVALNSNQETSPGGTVTYPISGSPLPAGGALAIVGDLDYDQPLDLPSGGNYSPTSLENQLDRATMQLQQLKELVDRSPKLPVTSAVTTAQLVEDILRVAESADNLDTVADNIDNVNAVGENIETVVENLGDITNFASVYLGGKTADPALRNNGGSLQPGDLYFNTVTDRMRVYGTAWADAMVNAGTIGVQQFSGTGSQTAFTLSADPVTENNTQVFISGVYQQKSEYSVSGTTLTFTSAPPAGTNNIEVVTTSAMAIGQTNASAVTFTPAGTGATPRPAEGKLREMVSVKDFGATGNGTTDDSAAIALADAYAVSVGAVLFFPAGTYRCKAITLHDVCLEGKILAYGSAKADAVVLAGSVDAGDRQVFDWSATDPTNLPGTTYPILFAVTSTFGEKVNVKWFGATGDNVTDDTAAINACATAMSFAQVYGTPYATKRGPVTMYSPRGNYRIAGTVCLTLGTVLTGEASGSNPLSSWIKDDVTYGATADDMIWWVGDNETHTSSASQAVIHNMSFIWRPSLDHSTSTLQLDSAFMCFKAQAISVKFHGCWFLGSPQKGSVFSWGNKHTADGGGGLVKTNTPADADGLWVVLDIYDTFFDVIYGTLASVTDKGYGLISIHTAYIYQLWLGLANNFSTHSTQRLEMVINSSRLEGIGIQTAPQIRDIQNWSSIVTGGRMRYRNMDVTLNNPKIINKVMNGNSFFFSQSLENTTMIIDGGTVDSTDATVRYFWPTFQLEYYANALTLKGVDFVGGMIPGSGVSAPFKAFISKFNGDVSNNGSTTKLRITGCDIDIGSGTTYLINKQAGTYSTMGNVEINSNVFRQASSTLSFDTANVATYRIKNNIWPGTANVIETS